MANITAGVLIRLKDQFSAGIDKASNKVSDFQNKMQGAFSKIDGVLNSTASNLATLGVSIGIGATVNKMIAFEDFGFNAKLNKKLPVIKPVTTARIIKKTNIIIMFFLPYFLNLLCAFKVIIFCCFIAFVIILSVYIKYNLLPKLYSKIHIFSIQMWTFYLIILFVFFYDNICRIASLLLFFSFIEFNNCINDDNYHNSNKNDG